MIIRWLYPGSVRTSDDEVTRPHPLFKLLCALGLLSLILMVGRMIEPADSRASISGAAPIGLRTHEDGKLLGALRSGEHTIHVFERGGENLFTVYGPSGELLGENLSAEELRQTVPELDAAALTAEVDTASTDIEPR